MGYIIDVKTSHPKNYTSQEDIRVLLNEVWPKYSKYIDQFSKSSSVVGRHLSLPLIEYKNLGNFGERNNHWLNTALSLQKENMKKIFEQNNVLPNDVGAIFSTSVTGLAIPTLESRLMNEFKINPRAKRIPIFGLGCLGGVALINRATDYLKSFPDEVVILMATELCSLTFQFEDQSIANFVGTSLFADGAAMVLMAGKNHPLHCKAKLEVLNTASFFYPDSERIMGWEIVANGFQIVLSGDVPLIVKNNLSKNLSEFLEENKLNINDTKFYISHPGGPKVLDALSEIVTNLKSPFELSYQSLKELGNMSSVSVLDVMRRNFEANRLKSAEIGMMLAMGPAFASEINLIKVL